MKITKITNGWNNLQEVNDELAKRGASLQIGFPNEHETIREVFIKEINDKTKGIVIAHNDVLNDDVGYICKIENDELYLDIYGTKTVKLVDEEEDKMELEINYNKENETVKVGDVISTTTSSIDYNNVTGVFEKTNDLLKVVVKHIDSDYSEYDERKCRTGGQYGYDFYEVIKIQEVE